MTNFDLKENAFENRWKWQKVQDYFSEGENYNPIKHC